MVTWLFKNFAVFRHAARRMALSATAELLVQYVVFLVTLDIAYLCKKFYNSSFSYSWGMYMALKLKRPRSFQRTVCRVYAGTCYDQSEYKIWSIYYERILVKIVVFERGWITLSANFRRIGRRPPTTQNVSVRKLVHGLSRGVLCVMLRFGVLVQSRRVTDRQTDTLWWLIPALV